MADTAVDPLVHALFAQVVPFLVLAGLVGMFLGGLWRSLEQSAPRLLRSHPSPRRRKAARVSAANRDTESIPDCPMCNVPMAKRVARQGPRAGRHFWGCSNFPMCRCTKDVARK